MKTNLTKNEIEAIVFQALDSIATCQGINLRPLTTAIQKLLSTAFPYMSDREEFITEFLDGYNITGDKSEDRRLFAKYIKFKK